MAKLKKKKKVEIKEAWMWINESRSKWISFQQVVRAVIRAESSCILIIRITLPAILTSWLIKPSYRHHSVQNGETTHGFQFARFTGFASFDRRLTSSKSKSKLVLKDEN